MSGDGAGQASGDLVTAYPVAANHGHWWLAKVRHTSRSRLHAIPGDALDRTDEDAVDALCASPWPVLTSACGHAGEWTMPGPFSRLGMQRCGHCCRKLGIAAGWGTPANEGSAVA
jgi:hypothetical protein